MDLVIPVGYSTKNPSSDSGLTKPHTTCANDLVSDMESHSFNNLREYRNEKNKLLWVRVGLPIVVKRLRDHGPRLPTAQAGIWFIRFGRHDSLKYNTSRTAFQQRDIQPTSTADRLHARA